MASLEQQKKELRKMVYQDSCLPDYFKDLVIWKLDNDDPSEFWVQKVRESIQKIEKYI